MKHEEIVNTEEETKTILPEEQEKHSKELAEGEKPEELKDDSSVNALASSTNPDQKDVRYWICSAGPDSKYWEDFYQKGIIAIGWPLLENLAQYSSQKDMDEAVDKAYLNENGKNNKKAVWEFSHEMKIGDILYIKRGRKEVLGKGVIKSDYIYDETQPEYRNIHKVEWHKKGVWNSNVNLPVKTLTDITNLKTREIVQNLVDENDQAVVQENESCRYWWLNANDQWKFSDLAVGDVESYTIKTKDGNYRKLKRNFVDIKPGDKFIGYQTSPVREIVAIGEVSDKNDKEVYFKKTETVVNTIRFKTLEMHKALEGMEFLRMKNKNGTLFKLTKSEYEYILALIHGTNVPTTDETDKNYNKEKFLSEVFVTEEQYDEMEAVLKEKKNIILQGAPGVGKTFVATRLAYAMMGEKNDDRIKSVQFHQNYSYEDFIMGYKPDGTGFTLKYGVFYNFCKEAVKHQDSDPDNDQKFFFIIDEINRGNMSKIFGEMLSRIENDYREKEITPAYEDKPFSIPRNLYIIGMMNTADRSLAMIDYALRRRFSFFDMEPGFENEKFEKYQEGLENKLFDELIAKIIDLNATIEKDRTLGNGFCIGHSYFCNLTKETCTPEKLRTIVKYDILPTLKEYWFDEKDTYNKWKQQLEDLFHDKG